MSSWDRTLTFFVSKYGACSSKTVCFFRKLQTFRFHIQNIEYSKHSILKIQNFSTATFDL